MGRPFTVIGFTLFVTLFFICFLGPVAAYVLFCVGILLCVVFACIKHLRQHRQLLTAFVCVVLASVLFLAYFHLDYLPVKAFFGKEHRIKAIVYDYPDYQYDRYFYELKVVEIDGKQPDHSFLLRTSFEEDPGADLSDILCFRAEIFENGAGNEISRLNYVSKRIYAGCYGPETVKLIKHSDSFDGVHALFCRYRHALIISIKRLIPAANAALSAAVLTGDKSYIPTDILEQIHRVSISHIICVSGLHLSIIASFMLSSLKKMKVPRKLRYLGAAGFILFFMALCSFTGSVVRAGIMFLVYVFAELLLAMPDSKNSLGLAAAIILLVNPFNAVNIGFMFSFCATLSIITVAAPMTAKLREKLNIGKKSKAIKALFSPFEILVVSVCVNVCCLPLSVLLFRQLSLLAVIANVFILPIASALLITSGLSALLGLLPLSVFGVITYPIAWFNSALSAYTIKVVELLASLKFAQIHAGGETILICLACVFSVMAVSLMFIKNKKVFRLLAVVCIFAVFSNLALLPLAQKRTARVHVFSSGYGMCIAVNDGEHNFLIDTGADASVYTKIENRLSSDFRERFDYMIVTGNTRSESGNFERLVRNNLVSVAVVPPGFVCSPQLGLDEKSIVETDTYSLETDSETDLEYYVVEKICAVVLSIKNERILILNQDHVLLSMLPEHFRNADFLIVKGQAHKYIVNSTLHGIIEIGTQNSKQHVHPIRTAYYSTAEHKDIQIDITNTKTTIGYVNKWRV